MIFVLPAFFHISCNKMFILMPFDLFFINTKFFAAEDPFLQRILSPEVQGLQFKLAPAFAIYMAARQRLLYPLYGISDADSKTRVLVLLTKAANFCHGIGRVSSR